MLWASEVPKTGIPPKGDDDGRSICNNVQGSKNRVPCLWLAVVHPGAPHARKPDDSDLVDQLRAYNDAFEPLLPCLGISDRPVLHALHDCLYTSLHPNFLAHR